MRRITRSPKAAKFDLWTDRKILPSVVAKRDPPDSGAILGGGGLFRYVLTRSWDYSRPVVCFVMLNPSTGDASEDDQTIRKCVGFARTLGFGGMIIVNLWAYRTKSPDELKRAKYLVGPSNDFWIEAMLGYSDEVICAWGENACHPIGHKRIHQVEEILRKYQHTPMALKINAGGAPSHPLMLSYSCKPVSYVPLALDRSKQ